MTHTRAHARTSTIVYYISASQLTARFSFNRPYVQFTLIDRIYRLLILKAYKINCIYITMQLNPSKIITPINV